MGKLMDSMLFAQRSSVGVSEIPKAPCHKFGKHPFMSRISRRAETFFVILGLYGSHKRLML
jgi:hypothetical protein